MIPQVFRLPYLFSNVTVFKQVILENVCVQEAPPPTYVCTGGPSTYICVQEAPLHLHMCTGGPSTYICIQEAPLPTYICAANLSEMILDVAAVYCTCAGKLDVIT